MGMHDVTFWYIENMMNYCRQITHRQLDLNVGLTHER